MGGTAKFNLMYSATVSTNTTSNVDVLFASFTMPCFGELVMIGLMPDPASASDSVSVSADPGNQQNDSFFEFWRDATMLSSNIFEAESSGGSAKGNIPPGALCVYDHPPAGSRTFYFYVRCTGFGGAASRCFVNNCLFFGLRL